MNKLYLVVAFLVTLNVCIHASQVTPGNILATLNPGYDFPSKEGPCTNNGTLLEMTPDGEIVQQIQLPAECLFFLDNYSGYITLSRDRLSAVVPCCFDFKVTPQTVGFVQIFFDGTTSAMQTVQLPMNTTEPHNMVLDGEDLWFVGRNYAQEEEFQQLFYANVASGKAVPLNGSDLFFVDIVGNELLVTNYFDAEDGLLQVGSSLPKTENQTLTPLLNLGNALDWFVRTNEYAYYSQYYPYTVLVRCDPNTWEPLYSLNTTDELIHFVVVATTDTDITIVGTQASGDPGSSALELVFYHDDGVQISFINATESLLKIGSLTPKSHCTSNKTDFDETDVDCGGSLCEACQNGKKCVANSDCVSNFCDSNKTCAVPTAPIPNTPSKTSASATISYMSVGYAMILLASAY